MTIIIIFTRLAFPSHVKETLIHPKTGDGRHLRSDVCHLPFLIYFQNSATSLYYDAPRLHFSFLQAPYFPARSQLQSGCRKR